MHELIENYLNPYKRPYDSNRGFSQSLFVKAIQNTFADKDNGIKETPGTDIIDPYSLEKKPSNVPSWNNPPLTPQEEAIYYGVHIHNESNPLGLHSHVIGGSLGGAHSHGPQNRVGAHTHNSKMRGTLDGIHVHGPAENKPCGKHCHIPDNFG